MECVKAAVLDLPLVKSLGFAYVVPYKGKPTFTIGYKGLIQLAQRTGKYKTINAGNVYEGELLGEDRLSGMLDLSGERTSNEVIGYFAYFRLLNGYEKVLYMSKEDMVAYAQKYSPAYNSKYTPWKTEFDKMAQKTVLRRLIGTYGPMSVEMVKAIESDDVGKTPHQEIKENANQTVIDVEATEVTVDTDTGEVIDIPDESPEAESLPFDMYE
jgi:recombination protein RecT